MKHPAILYYGSKWRIAQWVIKHFPPHNKYNNYIEPCGGSAAVLLCKKRSGLEVYNDIDNNIAANTNKYIEITISSDNDINQLNTSTNVGNISNTANTRIYSSNLQKYRTKIASNKNIWVSSNSNFNNKKTTQLSDTINLSDSIETSNLDNLENNINNLYKLGMIYSNGSDLSKSDILFEYN